MSAKDPDGLSDRTPRVQQPGVAGAAALEGLLALDLTGELGWLLGKILADLGATVLKIDPPGGDPGRHKPPLIHGPAGSVSATWVAFNAGKQRLDLDLAAPGDRARLLELAGGAGLGRPRGGPR